ncbi:glycosyltransferase family 39 protein [uncultured Mucilaginibacter sp.]|uniref:ArnT family glycosyltransferase n=1 Tax=uncultured Mucilaginibacter sp. TaxID=797541 RepID=UPI0025DAABEA|nr:glycosyltransferase family 39 protein [uncultured Mucilaginibacter sp.]
MNYRKQLFYLITVSTLIKIFSACTQELSNVEAYYRALATQMQWNYFDHPPIVAWLIRLTTLNLSLHSEIFVRLGAIVSSAICIWLMFKIGTALYNARAGWFAALLYATSIYAGMSIAAFILPDSPQMVFWLASVYTLIKIVRLAPGKPQYGYQWLLFGLFAGLSIMCKVHGVLLWLGAVMYLLFYNRTAFKNKYVFMAMGITVIIISPILLWNIQHDFISYRFHSSRVTIAGSPVNSARFLKQFISIVFSTGPIHFVLLCIGIYAAVRGKLLAGKNELKMLLLCSLPLIIIVLLISLFNEVLPHWPGPALSTLLLLPAVQLAVKPEHGKRRTPRVLKFSIAYFVLVVLLGALSINYFPGTLSAEKQGMKMGADDATLDMYGWRQAGMKFDSLHRMDLAMRVMPAQAPVIIADWITAAHIDYYIGEPAGVETWGLGDAFSLHQYYWMNDYKRPLLKGESAYLVIPSNLFSFKNFNKVTGEFRNYNFALIFPEYRGGMICKEYYVIRLNGYKGQQTAGDK